MVAVQRHTTENRVEDTTLNESVVGEPEKSITEGEKYGKHNVTI
jgi:hypothetical protein